MNPWNTPEEKDYNERIFLEELDGFLPARIFDAHTHVGPEDGFPADRPYSCGGVPIRSYNYQELERDLTISFPGRRCEALCFGFPDPAYPNRLINRYVGGCADFRRFFPLRLLDPRRDRVEEVIADLEDQGFLGFKPYPDFARPDDLPHAEIAEMLPEWAMAMAHERSLLVMLHIPRPGRLEDPLNRRQLAEICSRWPGARIVLAHAGRAYYLRGITGWLEGLRELPNLFFDTAMVQNWEVLAYLFRRVPIRKVLFGSDTPIALAQGKAVEINHQYTYVTPRPWSLRCAMKKRNCGLPPF